MSTAKHSFIDIFDDKDLFIKWFSVSFLAIAGFILIIFVYHIIRYYLIKKNPYNRMKHSKAYLCSEYKIWIRKVFEIFVSTTVILFFLVFYNYYIYFIHIFSHDNKYVNVITILEKLNGVILPCMMVIAIFVNNIIDNYIYNRIIPKSNNPTKSSKIILAVLIVLLLASFLLAYICPRIAFVVFLIFLLVSSWKNRSAISFKLNEERTPIRLMSSFIVFIVVWIINVFDTMNDYTPHVICIFSLILGKFIYFDTAPSSFIKSIKDTFEYIPHMLAAIILMVSSVFIGVYFDLIDTENILTEILLNNILWIGFLGFAVYMVHEILRIIVGGHRCFYRSIKA